MVLVPGRPVRDARDGGHRDRVLHPQGAAPRPLPRLPHGGGRQDPARDPRHRHDAAAVERDEDRARSDRPPERRARRERVVEPVRHRPADRDARARLRVVARAHRARVPRLPAEVQAPAHHHRGAERLLREERPERSPREARDRPRGAGGGHPLRGRDRRGPVEEAAPRPVQLHGVRPVSGGLSRLEHGQAAQPEAPDHGSPRRRRRGRSGSRRAWNCNRSCRTR